MHCTRWLRGSLSLDVGDVKKNPTSYIEASKYGTASASTRVFALRLFVVTIRATTRDHPLPV